MVVDGKLEITPNTDKVTVTITEKSDTVKYDGNEHTVTGYKSMTADNELYDVKANVKETPTEAWTAKGTNVGEYPVGIESKDFKNTNANFSNVEFVVVDGKLEITPNTDKVTVTITEKSDTVKYDGNEHIYYRRVARDCDMIYLATNFGTVFDPSTTYSTDEAYVKTVNRTGIRDKKLAQLAVDMRKTEPGDVLSYCRKWVAFQERWTEVLPAIPVYSNVYFDFYTTRLQNYRVTENQTWTQAIVGATLTQTAE